MEQIQQTTWKADDDWHTEPELRMWLMISRDTFRRWRKKGVAVFGCWPSTTVPLADVAGMAEGLRHEVMNRLTAAG
jgi:hypothetical protein